MGLRFFSSHLASRFKIFLTGKTLEIQGVFLRIFPVKKIHFPEKMEDTIEARERLAFNEFVNLLTIAKERKN